MISFESDYNNGAHPAVLRHLIETNELQSASYGYDSWSKQAREKIREACQCPEADIFFLAGGTQTNTTVINAMLPLYGAVIAASTAHINVHESGAIEANGHKVIALPSHDGRVTAEELEGYLQRFYADPTWEHMAVPGMVYITFPTELGTIYKAREIKAIHEVAEKYQLPLFIDGARLGYGLASPDCDFDLPWLAQHCEAFYIGGTKVGALCGEAVIFTKKAPKGFFTIIKRQGALLAKSRLVGVQFEALFIDNLYLTISRHAIDMAMRLRQIFIDAGITIKDSPTNQQFVVLTNQQKDMLMEKVLFETWEPLDTDHMLCRFVTSWATTEVDLQALADALKTIS
ncbi:MAG: amino acid lyase [Prevotella sp.]|nr:amino acid lyase [Prevotella sp.]